MFGSLKKIIENTLNLDYQQIAVEVYYNDSIYEFIIKLNTTGQLTQGLNSDGEIIGTYTINTDIMSEGGSFTFDGQSFEKIAGQPYNFVDTGYFLKSFDVGIYPDGFTIIADDAKEDENLTDKFGKNILGLTNESLNELVKKMLPVFIAETRKAMFA
jgi:hypothetical protein